MITINYLIVAGGGAGGQGVGSSAGDGGSGGYGGQVLQGTLNIDLNSSYTITIGNGGSGDGGGGSNSSFNTLIANGGFAGENGGDFGGVGAGGNNSGINGGPGIVSSISQTSTGYGGGGGGGGAYVGAPLGTASDGGKPGSPYAFGTPSPAVDSRGGGGAGGGGNDFGGDGGSGIVIISYPTNLYGADGTGGTITHINGYTIHTFISSEIFSPPVISISITINGGSSVEGLTSGDNSIISGASYSVIASSEYPVVITYPTGLYGSDGTGGIITYSDGDTIQTFTSPGTYIAPHFKTIQIKTSNSNILIENSNSDIITD